MGYKGGQLASLADEAPIHRFARRATREVGKDMGRRVRRHTPVSKGFEGESLSDFQFRRSGHRRPGTLRDSWEVGYVSFARSVAGLREVYTVPVFTHDPVAPHVEWATRPHIIEPKKAGGTLAFQTEGGTVFAKLVHHPGSRGAHMLATTVAEVAVSWRATVGEEWRLTARLFWRGGGGE